MQASPNAPTPEPEKKSHLCLEMRQQAEQSLSVINHHGIKNMQASPIAPAPKPEKLLRLNAVEEMCGLKRSSIYAGMKANPPTFPYCIRLSTRAVAWRESDLQAWIAARAEARPQGVQNRIQEAQQ